MKRILLLPVKTEGIIDVRKQDYYIINDVQYLEQIQNTLLKNRKSIKDYKFCQFEQKALIPFFIKIKDKLSNGFQEFEIENVKFKDAPIAEEEKQKMIKQRHLLPIQQNMQNIINKTVYLTACEKLGDEVKEDDFINLKLEKEKLDKTMNEFEYQKFLDEIV